MFVIIWECSQCFTPCGGDCQVYRAIQKKMPLFNSSYFLQVLQFSKTPSAMGGNVFICTLFPPRFLVINNMFGPIPSLRLDQATRTQPLDYFLWGYLKERIYQDNPDAIERLTRNIGREIRKISIDMLERVVTFLNIRVAAVIQ